MSLDVMKQALEVLSLELPTGSHLELKNDLRAAIEQAHDWDEVEALRASLREHMAEIQRLRDAIEQEPVAWMNPSWIDPDTRGWASDSFESIQIEGWIPLYTDPRQWQGLTDDEIKAPIQRAMQHFGFDPTQYSLGGMATIGFLGLVKEIETKLREKNNG